MKKLNESKDSSLETGVLLNSIQHETSTALDLIHYKIEMLEAFALEALGHDRAELTAKIKTITQVGDKLAGAIKAVPLPVPSIALDTLAKASELIKDKIVGDMMEEMTSGMDSAEASMKQARLTLLCGLQADRMVIAQQAVVLSEKRRSLPLIENEVERYLATRQVEKACLELEAYTRTFNAKMVSMDNALDNATAQAKTLASEGPETGHQLSTKRMPEQHGLTQNMYQGAVLKYMEERFSETSNPSWLKTEEIKMLEQAFPERFVMDRTFIGESAKQSSEIGREKTLLREAKKMDIRRVITSDVTRRVIAEQKDKWFPKKGANLKSAIEDAIKDDVEKEMKRLCYEHIIEQQVNAALVPSALDPTQKVCAATQVRHQKLKDAMDPVVGPDGVLDTSMVKISTVKIGSETKDCIGAVLRQEAEKLAASDHNDEYLNGDTCRAAKAAAEQFAATEGAALDSDVKKAQLLKALLTEINTLPEKTKAERFACIDAFETDFKAKFNVEAKEELTDFVIFTALHAEKVDYLDHAAQTAEAGMYQALGAIEAHSFHLCGSTAEVDALKSELLDKVSEIRLQNSTHPPEPFRVITDKIASVQASIEERSETKLSNIHEQANDAMAKVDACKTTDFSACVSADDVARVAANVEQLIAAQEALLPNFSDADKTSLTSNIVSVRTIVNVSKEQALGRISDDLSQFDAKKTALLTTLEGLEIAVQKGGETSSFNPDSRALMSQSLADLKDKMGALDSSKGLAEQNAQLMQLEARAKECETMIDTMTQTDFLRYDGVGKFPSVVQEALNVDRSAMTLDQKVAQDHFAASVIASYRVNPHLMKAEIDELRVMPYKQMQALVGYHAVHVFDDATQENVAGKVAELREHLQSEVKRIEKKEGAPKEGTSTAYKLHLLKQEDARLEALQGMVGTKVCFSSIQSHLKDIVEKISEAANIQRNLIHSSTTTTATNLLGTGSKFSEIKQQMHERLQRIIDKKHLATVANEAHLPDEEEETGEGRSMHG